MGRRAYWRPMTSSLPRSARLVAAAIAVAVAFGCGPRAPVAGNPNPAADSTGYAAADSTTWPALEPVTAAQLLARVQEPGSSATIVNVWATWCAPCREEFPELVRLANEHRAHGLRVLFVSTDFDDQQSAVRRFLARHGARAPWLIKTGKDMEFIDGLDPRWSGALPATIVYDAHGKPVTFWEGRADYARFEAAVAPLLAASTTR